MIDEELSEPDINGMLYHPGVDETQEAIDHYLKH